MGEDLEEQFRSGGGQGDEAQFVDDQQAEAGQIPLQVEPPPLVPGFQRSALPRRTGATPQHGSPAGVLRCHGAAGPPGLPHGHGVWSASPGQPQPEVLAGNSPVYGPGWEFPLVVAQGVAGKPGLFLPGRTVYFCPFQPGVQQDDALRLRQGLGERAGGQESGPAHEIETLVLAREVKACYPCGRRN